MNRSVLDSVALGIVLVGLLFGALAMGGPIEPGPVPEGADLARDAAPRSIARVASARDATAPVSAAPALDRLAVRPVQIAAARVARDVERRRAGVEPEGSPGAAASERGSTAPESGLARLLMVPEPGTAAQVGVGLVLLAVAGRRRL